MLCHVALARHWDQALATGAYTRSTLDEAIADAGFMHASDSYEQASRVVRFLFPGLEGEGFALLDLERGDLERAGLSVVIENASPHDPASEKFPHVYGGPLPVAAVARVQRFDTVDELLRVLDRGEGAPEDSPEDSPQDA